MGKEWNIVNGSPLSTSQSVWQARTLFFFFFSFFLFIHLHSVCFNFNTRCLELNAVHTLLFTFAKKKKSFFPIQTIISFIKTTTCTREPLSHSVYVDVGNFHSSWIKDSRFFMPFDKFSKTREKCRHIHYTMHRAYNVKCLLTTTVGDTLKSTHTLTHTLQLIHIFQTHICMHHRL